MSILNKLKLNNDKVLPIESSTRNQANDPEWFKHRKTDLLHLYVIGLIAMAQKHQSVLKH